MKKKVALTITSIALVAAMAIGGTFAWLTKQSETVTNTFIASAGITQLVLNESTLKADGTLDTTKPTLANSYTMIPGETYPKDPKVTIETAVESYVFVQVEEKNDLATYIQYVINTDTWTKLEDGVYYRIVEAGATTDPLYILADNQVTVNNVDLSKITSSSAPALEFKAYSFQTAGFENTSAGAWTESLAAANQQTQS